ncbi:MAG: hypothetical protein PVF83_08345 [Anaerolineales bacterium]
MIEKPFFQKRKYENWLILLLLFIIIVICYGLLIPWMGFYFDDWRLIYVYKVQGVAGFVDFYQYDRPLLIWTHALTFPFIGTSRVGWHIAGLIIRWVSVIAMWWTLYGLWPNQKKLVTWMAMIYAVYPAFLQQPIPVTYSQAFVITFFVFISIGSMIWAYRMPKYYWPFTILSWLTACLHLFTVESWFGFELLRPVLLWYVLKEGNRSNAELFKRTLKKWLPFLVILIIYIIWRFFILQLPGGGSNSPALLMDLFTHPFSTLIYLFETAFKEVSYLVMYVWSLTLDPENMSLTQPIVVISWVLVFTVIFGLSSIMGKTAIFKGKSATNEQTIKQGFVVGILGILLGFIPVWIAGRNLLGRHWTDRFALVPMIGASILLVSLLVTLVQKNNHRIVLVSVLVGLAIGAHLRNENTYRWEWDEEVQFYWQLYWRAPVIKPNTLIMNEDALFSTTSKYSVTLAINTLYSSYANENGDLLYYVYELQDEFASSPNDFLEGESIEEDIRNLHFTGYSTDNIILYYEPNSNPGACLWVLSQEDRKNFDLPNFTSQVVGHANFDRIEANEPYEWEPDKSIFGPEPDHTWCYFYQKANLAKQLSDWEKVTKLYEEAKESGYRSLNPYEDFPFVEGYAYQGDWEKAEEITRDAYKRHSTVKEKREFAEMICYVWNSLEENTFPSDERDVVIEEIYGMANCE